MRYLYPAAAALVALTIFAPSEMVAQGGSTGLSIGNYHYVSEQQSTLTKWFVTYSADVLNSGPARSGVTASVASLAPSATVVSGQGTLHFPAVPTNGHVTSSDTFTLLIDRTLPFTFTNLQWSFLNPSANAGAGQTVKVGTKVNLDGSASTNPNGGGPLTYAWAFVSRPAGSNAVLQNATTVMPSFVVDVDGNYLVRLTVDNGSAADSATVTISSVNSPPVAVAGANQSVAVGAAVSLNGSGSHDIDGDPLTYLWSFVSRPPGSSAVLQNTASVSPSFVADKPGSYIAQLVVNDGTANSTASTVTVTTGNTAPVANAGPNQSLKAGSLVQLTGAASTDVDGDPLTYHWTLIQIPANSTAALSDTDVVNPTFTAALSGTYVAQLVVNDGKAASAPSTVTISTNAILAPTADAGPNQTVVHGTAVTLHGSAADPQNLPVTFKWALITKPENSLAILSSSNVQSPSFVADLPGKYVAQLIASNGYADSAASTVTITTTNTAPVAVPGQNHSVAVGSTVMLDGSGSHDADNDPLTFSWSFLSRPQGSSATLSSTTSDVPSFIADLAGTYVLQLIVNDGFANSTPPATVTITASVMKITLTPDPLDLMVNTPGNLTVHLSAPAGPNGLVVKLLFDSSVISAPASIPIAASSNVGTIHIIPLIAGSTSMLASGPGYQSGSATVNVSAPNIAVTLSAPGLGVGRTITGTVTLSMPAPAAGTVVSLSAAPTGLITISPANVTIAAGGTTGSFSVTGASNGSATITASSGGFANGTATVLVAKLGAIALPPAITATPGQSSSLSVSLSTPAPSGGVTIALTSSDTSKFTVTPSVSIPQGATTPSTMPQISGVNFGSATLTASAVGYTSATQTVKVSGALSFSPQSVTIGAGGTQNLTLTLSAASPSALNVTISSSNTAVLTVPANVSIGANATTVTVPATAVAGGTATITATTNVANVSPGSATVVVTTFGSIGLPSLTSIELGQTLPYPVVLSTPAPQNGVTVTLSSSDANKVGISPTTVTIAAGQTQPATQPNIVGSGPGTAVITASAPGFGSATKSVQTTASLNFSPKTLSLSGTQSGTLTLMLSGAAPAGGLVVNLSASPTGIVGIPASVTIAAGAKTATVSVSGVVGGSTTITAAAVSPTVSSATASVTVQSASVITLPSNVSLNLGQSSAFQVTLSSPAPAGGVTVTLSDSDSSKVGLSTLSVTIPAGATHASVSPQVTGKNLGTATITASAPLYASVSQPVQVTGTIALSPQTLALANTATANLTLTLSGPAPAGGLTFSVISSDPTVAKVSAASFTIAAASSTVTIPVSGLKAGSAVIRASAPNLVDATANVTVNSGAGIIIPATLTIAPGDFLPFNVSLAQPAKTGVFITLTSSDPTKAIVTPSGVTIDAGQTTPSRQPSISGFTKGQVTITAAGPGLTPAVSQVTVGVGATLTPANLTINGVNNSGTLTLTLSSPAPGPITFTLSSSNSNVAAVPPSVLISQGTQVIGFKVTGIGNGSAVVKATAPGFPDLTANVTVQPAGTLSLSVSSANIQLQQSATVTLTLSTPAPSGGLSVSLNSSNTTNLTVSPSLVFIPQGQKTGTAQITGTDVGSSTLTASAPGFTPPAPVVVQIGATITWLTPNVTINGIGQQVLLQLKLSATVPQGQNGVLITLTSSHPGVAAVPPNATFFWDGSNAPTLRIPVTSVGPGTTIIHASGTNIAGVDATVTVTGPLALSTTSLPNGVAHSVYSATLIAAGGLTPYKFSATGLPNGLTLNTATGEISGTPAAAGTSTVNVTVTDSTTPTAQTVSRSFTLLIKTATAASVTAAGGSPQTANINTVFATPLQALVKDANNNPLSGITVTFTAPASGASGTFAGGNNTAVTNASGIATSAAFTANGITGSYSVNATVAGVAAPAVFALTNATGALTISATGGTPQSTKIPAPFAALLATVKDSSDSPVSGVTVTFTAPSTGASGTFASGVSTTATTNAQGVASSGVFTPNNTLGSYVVTATTPKATAAANFALTNLTGNASKIAATSGSGQSAKISTPFGAPLVATVTDAGNNPVSGVVVTFNAPASGASGTFAGGVKTATTNAQGVATSAGFTANNVLGTYSVTATAAGIAAPATFTLTNTQGVISITASGGTPQSAKIQTAFAARLVATVKDSGGNPIGNVVVTFTAPATGASGSFANGVNTATTNAQGVATSAAFTANLKIGSYVVTATTPNAAAPASFNLTNQTGPAATIAATGGTPQSAKTNTAFSAPLIVTVKDAGGNLVSGAVVTFSAPATGASGTFAGGVNTATTNAQGVATSAVFTANGTVGAYSVNATTAGIATPATFALSNTQSVLTITATAGTPQSAKINTDFATKFAAFVKNTNGDAVSGAVVTFSAPTSGPSGAFAGGVNTATTNAQGVATSAVFTANSKIGTYNVTASVPGGTVPATFVLTNQNGPAATIVATSGTPQSAKVKVAFGSPFVVTVTDAGGNAVSGVLVTFNAPASGASGNFAGGVNTATTNAQGIATSAVFTANLILGAYQVTASVPNVATPASFALTNLTGDPTAISANSGSGQSTQINTAFGASLVAKVTDAGGNPVSGVVVTFNAPASGAGGTFTGGVKTATTNAQGLATSASFTANNTVGSYTVTASTPGVATAATFGLTNTQIPVGSIAIAGGSQQSAPVNTAFTDRLKVLVKDSGNNPVSGILVTFTAPGTGASGTFAGGQNTATTDASGVATSAQFTANKVSGQYNVTASAGGKSVALQLTNLAGPAASIAISAGQQQGTPINTPFPSPLKVLVNDAFNNPVSGATVTFAVQPVSGAGATFAGGKNTATTDFTGIATSALLSANGTVGSYSVVASVNAGAVSTTFSLTNQPGTPTSITPVGVSQSTPINTAFPNPLKVVVKDVGGNPLRGLTVKFTAPASGPSGTFAGGVNTAITDGTGVATSPQFTANGSQGAYAVVATIVGFPGVPAANLSLTNTKCITGCGGGITVTDVTIGKNLQAPITILLSPAVPAAGVPFTIASSDPTKALVGNSKASVTVTIAGGTTSFSTEVEALVSSGTATISISAPGYATGTSTITFSPSGFVISGPAGIGGQFDASQGTTTALSVSAGPLDAGGHFTESQQVRAGFTVNVPVASSDTNLGTVTPTTVAFTGGNDTLPVSFKASAANTGNLNVTVTAPAGFSTPVNGSTLPINVTKTGLLPFTAKVGQGLEQDVNISLGAPAPSDVNVTITSNDPSKLKFSAKPGDPGAASIVLTIPTNHASSPTFYAQAFGNTGSVGYTASATSFGTVNGNVQLAPAGLAIQSPGGFGATSFSFSVNDGFAVLDIFTGSVDAGGNFIQPQLVAGGTTVSVGVTSSDTSKGTISSSPITIAGGTGDATTGLTPIANGSTTATATATGFHSASVVAKIVPQTGNLLFTGGDSTIGQNLASQWTVNLPQAAANDVQVTIQSSSAGLQLAATVSGAGSGTLNLTVPAGTRSVSFFAQGASNSGTATITASAAGYTNANTTVQLSQAAVVISPSSINGSAGGTANLTLFTVLLDANNTPSGTDEGPVQTATVTLASDHSSIAAAPATIKIQPGVTSANVPLTLGTAGTAVISITQPAGFSVPNIFRSTTVSVH